MLRAASALLVLLMSSVVSASSKEESFQAPADRVYSAALAAISAEWRVNSADPTLRSITFHVGRGLGRDPQDGTVVITPRGVEDCTVVASTRPARGGSVWGAGGGKVQQKALDLIRKALAAGVSAPVASLATPQAAASTSEPLKKKGGFWKKLGQGLLVGALVAGAAYAAAEGEPIYVPPTSGSEATRANASTQAYANRYANPFAVDTSLSGTRQTLGGLSFFNFSDGVTGSTQRVGSLAFHNLSNGVSGSSQRVGNMQFHNFNTGLAGSSLDAGNLTFYNFNDGVNGSSQRVGNMTFTHYSNGTSCTQTQFGMFGALNCQ